MNKYNFNIETTKGNLEVSINIEALNIHIKDSYKIYSSKEMKKILEKIMNMDVYKELAAAGFARSKEGLIREWKAHNVLYHIGYHPESTGSVDLNQGESIKRKIGYFFLSLFHWC